MSTLEVQPNVRLIPYYPGIVAWWQELSIFGASTLDEYLEYMRARQPQSTGTLGDSSHLTTANFYITIVI